MSWRAGCAQAAQEKPGQTLQATALVHEAYLRLVDTDKAQHWNSRGHFFTAAAEAMRRILIEKARQKSTRRRGQGRVRCELRDDDLVASPLGDELLDLDEALTNLTAIDADAAAVAKLRLFAGMSVEEIADIQRISPRTVKRNWSRARAWLGRRWPKESRSPSTGRGRGRILAPSFPVIRTTSRDRGRAQSIGRRAFRSPAQGSNPCAACGVETVTLQCIAPYPGAARRPLRAG